MTPLFAEGDACLGFFILIVAAAVIGGGKLAWDHYMMTNHPQIYIYQKEQEAREKARKQNMAVGVGINLLRIFLGGK